MKKLFVLLIAAALVIGCGGAAEASRSHREVAPHEHEENQERFDIGLYFDTILWQSENGDWEVGNKNTWEIQRDEFTTLFGAKYNVWSLFKK